MGLIMKKGVPYASGSEIPQGGTKGQVLAKASNISGDFEWANGGGGSGNTVLEPSRNAGELLGMKAVDGDKELRVFTDGQVIVIDGADSESFNLATQNALNTKQDTLESGTNIKKIGNHDLLGSGAINVATVNNKSLLDGGNVSTAKIIYDAEYQTTQIRDAESNAEIGINKVDGNTLNINEYAPDSRGQSQEVFNMNIPTKGYVDGALADKQDTLVSGTNIKTVNGESLLGAGNLNVGVNIEVNKEKWYGTYTDENGVTYQVYSKMIYIPALPSTAGITAYDHGISGIKQILQVYGFTADGFVLNAPRQNAQDNIAIYQMSKSASNKTLSIEVGKDRSSKSAYVVMVYAKNN